MRDEPMPAPEALPQSRAGLAADLRALGLAEGMAVIMHSSLRRFGWVIGGAQTVIQAMMDVLGPRGLLVMPTFTGGFSDPAEWQAPAVPEAWFASIRANMPPFDPARSPTRNMGAIPELFRRWPEVHRSGHPVMSLAAWGRDAAALVARHPLAWALGDDSPMGRLHDRDGWILLAGVGHNRNSSLHLAETRARHRRTKMRSTPVEGPNGLEWQTHPDVASDGGRLFPSIGADFEATGAVRIGLVGEAEARLMRQRELVRFGTEWLDRHLPEHADNH